MQAPNDRESPHSLPHHVPTIPYSPSSAPITLLTGTLVRRIGIGMCKMTLCDRETDYQRAFSEFQCPQKQCEEVGQLMSLFLSIFIP